MSLESLSKNLDYYLNYRNPLVWLSAFHMVWNVSYWNLTSHLQYKTKFFSRLFNSPKIAVYIHSLIVFSFGLTRNFLFKYVVEISNGLNLGINDIFVKILGYGVLAVGVLLVSSATYRLGVIGTFNGDAYGFLLPGIITSFPFNMFNAPMYLGSTLNFIAFSILKKSILGIALSFIVALVYLCGTYFEE